MKPFADLLAATSLPSADGGKDDKGTLFIVGGPPTCPGAVILAATAALRVGTGRVAVAVDASVAPHVAVAVPEIAVFGWTPQASAPPEIAERLALADVVVIGPGYTALDEAVVRSTARGTRGTVVLDAGALGSTFTLSDTLPVIAPNVTEAEMLLGPSPDASDAPRDESLLAKELSQRLGAPVAVRGASSVIADADDCWVFDNAPPGLGTPGSGDVFAGILGGLLAQGASSRDALALAVHLHAEAGRRLAETTPIGYLARDLVAELPHTRAASR